MKTIESIIIELWHTSRTALGGMQTIPTRSDRMRYIKQSLYEFYPEITNKYSTSPKQIWFLIEDTIC